MCWVRGPKYPSIHDITVFCGGNATTPIGEQDQDALYFQLGEGKQCVGDIGYLGEPPSTTHFFPSPS